MADLGDPKNYCRWCSHSINIHLDEVGDCSGGSFHDPCRCNRFEAKDRRLSVVANYQAKWRVGRKVGRTIYRQLGDEPSDDDPLIGVMDTPELAREAVAGANHLDSLGKLQRLNGGNTWTGREST